MGYYAGDKSGLEGSGFQSGITIDLQYILIQIGIPGGRAAICSIMNINAISSAGNMYRYGCIIASPGGEISSIPIVSSLGDVLLFPQENNPKRTISSKVKE